MKTDNEIIADFMGEVLTEEDQAHNFTLDQLPYRTNWNWLIPVVEKIERLGYQFWIGKFSVAVTKPKDEFEINTKGETKIQNAYKAVVEFIKRHNEKK